MQQKMKRRWNENYENLTIKWIILKIIKVCNINDHNDRSESNVE